MSQENKNDLELLPATTEESKAIKPINRDTVHRICSGQVVLSLAIAVKELVENAIDAGATTVEVRLKEYGSELIEVIDNGCGVEEFNFEALTLKHHTSKIRQFSDLSFIATLGFRGEALSSLCALSNLTVVTRHKSVEIGTKLEYDLNGHIKNKVKCARQVGTTVMLSNLFSSLPVRLKDFHKNLKREFSKMLELLYAYCIVAGVRIICNNQTKKGPRTTVVATQGTKSLKDNIICVFGTKQIETVIEFVLHNPSEKSLEEYNLRLLPDDPIPFKFSGYISKCTHGAGRSTSDRQFYFINNRPCDPTKLAKVVNEVYRSFNNNQYPFVVLNISIEQAEIDVNVTPDKRQVFMEKEKLLLATVKTSLLEMFKDFPSTFKMQNTSVKLPEITSPKNQSGLEVFRHFTESSERLLAPPTRGTKRKESNTKYEKKAKGILSFIYEKRMKIEDRKQELSDNSASEDDEKQLKRFARESYNSDDSDLDISTQDVSSMLEESLTDLAQNNIARGKNLAQGSLDSDEDISTQEVSEALERSLTELSKRDIPTQVARSKLLDSLGDLAKTPKKWDVFIEESPSCKIKKLKEKILTLDDIEETNDIEISYDTPRSPNSSQNFSPGNTISTSINDIEALLKKNLALRESKKKETVVKFRSEITSNNAEEELNKQISKNMFEKMEVIGQFNKGFIIARLDSDLFIIDQHATDEKYNFETLQQTTVLENQKLVNPKLLDLTAANESILIDNIDVFIKNGFTFNIDENAEARKKVSLTAIPVSKNYQFGKEDIDELLFMLQEDAMTTVCRPSRVRAMFASRACRKSVMVGSVLSKSDMRRLVDHMGQIDQPWNCPHGRPTMRHLINLALIQEK